MKTIAATLVAWLLICAQAWAALDPQAVAQLADDDIDRKIEAIARLVATGDARAAEVLQALGDDALVTIEDGKRVAIVAGDRMRDAATGAEIEPAPQARESITINNRIRGELSAGLAALKLTSPDAEVRREAASELQGTENDALLPIIHQARERETEPSLKAALALTEASLAVRSSDPLLRLAAVKALAGSDSPQVRQLLSDRLVRANDGTYTETDERVRAAAQASLTEIGGRLRKVELIANLFSGFSLGSILLLAALGLAITFGLMGIINMAHGELLMIGAYCTYVVQHWFRSTFADHLDWYLAVAVPFAFVITAAVGIALERTVIRFFYGRPLETLLATWGISLLIIQGCRSLFGAQNVEVANPTWMSGGIALAGGVVLPYNRIAIIVFALFVLTLVWVLLSHTRMGLFVRAVTQNRAMASCCGVPTARVDMLTFGLGSGIAGLGGVALSQIGNVGPELGQGYIIDSFMVVVLGGVGQLAGTVIAAFGLGALSKFMEPWAGAVLAKIALLVIIILFIQKRPQGLFAIKGRSAEA